MENMDLKGVCLVQSQGEIVINANDIANAKTTDDNLLDIFIKAAFRLKSKVNQVRYEETETDWRTVMVAIPKQSYALITTLKIFIDRYCEQNLSKDLFNFINNKLNECKDELYFNDIGVNITKNDCETIDNVIDSLTVKFYQTVIYFLHMYFNNDGKVLIIGVNEDTTAYVFKYRLMNIIESSEFAKGKKIVYAEK